MIEVDKPNRSRIGIICASGRTGRVTGLELLVAGSGIAEALCSHKATAILVPAWDRIREVFN
jgi:hypothetical protein